MHSFLAGMTRSQAMPLTHACVHQPGHPRAFSANGSRALLGTKPGYVSWSATGALPKGACGGDGRPLASRLLASSPSRHGTWGRCKDTWRSGGRRAASNSDCEEVQHQTPPCAARTRIQQRGGLRREHRFKRRREEWKRGAILTKIRPARQLSLTRPWPSTAPPAPTSAQTAPGTCAAGLHR